MDPNRRRAITILAGASAAALAGCRSPEARGVTRWRGVLFNAEVDLVLQGVPPGRADRLVGQCVEEMQRLERMFSLYVSDSVLCRLNRDGLVEEAPAEFIELVGHAVRMAERTGGAFDPTVQPYWLWLREAVESGRVVTAAGQREELAKVDYREVRVSPTSVGFAKAGMGMTLNGIAQGWITDRVCELFRAAGARHCLVNLGEFVAIGAQADGEAWRVGIGGGSSESLQLRDRALAVSSGAGFYFGTGAGRNHLIDPRSGRCAEDTRVVAVVAPDATTADALSTACAVLGDEEARSLVAGWADTELRILRPV